LKSINCIICPKSCRIEVRGSLKSVEKLQVSGQECSKGKKYAISEICDPRRIFTSTVAVKNGEIKLVPVRSSKPIRKAEWKNGRDIIRGLSIAAPIGIGKVLIEDFTEKDVKLIAAREIKAF
jgi:CxxC motif-containing protein